MEYEALEKIHENIDEKILKERNGEMFQIQKEIEDLSEISILLSSMINDQGEKIDCLLIL